MVTPLEGQHGKPVKILLVEDSSVDARLVSGLLRNAAQSTDCTHVRNLSDALARLSNSDTDVILLDLNLGDSSGYETFDRVRRAAPGAAILVLSGSDDEELASRTVREGGQDYLVKGSFDGKLLLRAIRYAVERKTSEEALRKSEATVRAIFENALDAIVIFDDKGEFVEANEAAAVLLGVRRSRLIGSTVHEFAGEGFDREMKRMRLSQSGRGQFNIRRHDGTERVVDYCFKANILQGQHLGVMRDITEQQSLEDQLRVSQKMEAVGRLAGSVAHDFNNILAVISGHAELIELRGEDETVRGKATRILAATTKASSLTKQLLAFGRKQVVAPTLLNLADVISDVSSMITCLLGPETHFAVLSSKSAGSIYADQGQMEQVLLNLATNAHEAMPFGGTLTIALERVDTADLPREVPPGSYVRLAVKDTGSGIDPAIENRIFDPFFTTKKTGSGLGLSTVAGIVKQAGGHVVVESIPQKGTTFNIYLPRIADAPERAVKATRDGMGKISGEETILLVDDEEELSNSAAEYLQECGYKVLKARAADEAMEVARRFEDKISLLVTDIVMPGGSGRVLVEHMKEARPETGVLVISGHPDDAVHQHGFLSSTSFLQKPFTLQSLGVKIRSILDDHKPA
ncbi:MAG TPA: response regulator [Verrucomicrobiae bacterium]|nr:response regulator [Verrucomicrobiae bacterium]